MKKLFFLIMVSIMVVSCKNEEVVGIEDTTIQEISSQKETGKKMLHFGNVDELKSFINEKVEGETDFLDEARKYSEQGVYNPLLLVYNLEASEAKELGIEEKAVPTVASDDDMLLLMLNESGEIGIEDKIFRIDGDFVYTYSEGSGNHIDEFNEAYKAGEIRMERGDTYKFSKELSVYMHNNVKVEEESARSQTSYGYFSSNYRMRARQFNGFWGFYSSIGANTKVEKRKRVWWWYNWNTVKTYNRLEYNVEYKAESTMGFPTLYLSDSGGVYPYANQAQKIYAWSVGFPLAPEIYTPLGGQTKHWAHWYTTPVNTVSITLNY